MHESGNLFLIAQGGSGAPNVVLLQYYKRSCIFIGDMDHNAKGLAFDCGVAPQVAQVPTLSEWGLIAMAGILGIVGFMVIRRRKATA